MNSLNARQLRNIVASTVAAFALVCGFATSVQAQLQSNAPAYADTTGSVTEPLGEGYLAPSKLNPKLARVTLYRPSQGFARGVAHLEINGHYHTSLQRGGFTEICVEPASLELATQMVFIDGELKNYQNANATLKPEKTPPPRITLLPIAVLLTRVLGAQDFLTGIELKQSLLGKLASLLVHHVFPEKQLYDHDYTRSDVNAVANFAFLTQQSKLIISNDPDGLLP